MRNFVKCLSVMPCILGKNISEFIFEHSRFQIAEAFHSLLCDGRSAAAVNKSRTCWAAIVIVSLFLLKSTENMQRVTLSCSCCFTAVTEVLVAVNDYIFNIFGDVYTQVLDQFRSPPPWSPNDMIVTDICQYIMGPI